MGAIGLYEQLAIWRFVPDPLALSGYDTWLLFALPILGVVLVALFSLVWWYGRTALQRTRWYPTLYGDVQALRRQVDDLQDRLNQQERRSASLSQQLAIHAQLLEGKDDDIRGLHDRVEKLHHQIAQHQARARFLIRHLVAYAQLLAATEGAFLIAGAVKVQDEVMLVLRRKPQPVLQPERLLLIINPQSGELLGTFKIFRTDRNAYLVQAVIIWEPVWWKHVRIYADSQVEYPTTAIAFLLPREA